MKLMVTFEIEGAYLRHMGRGEVIHREHFEAEAANPPELQSPVPMLVHQWYTEPPPYADEERVYLVYPHECTTVVEAPTKDQPALFKEANHETV